MSILRRTGPGSSANRCSSKSFFTKRLLYLPTVESKCDGSRAKADYLVRKKALKFQVELVRKTCSGLNAVTGDVDLSKSTCPTRLIRQAPRQVESETNDCHEAVLSHIRVPVGSLSAPFDKTERGKSESLSVAITHNIDTNDHPQMALEQILRGKGVPAGLVVLSNCSTPPHVRLNLSQGTTVAEALNALVASSPEYRWQTDGNVINLLPMKAAAPLLETEIREFRMDTTDSEIGAVLSELMALPVVRKRQSELKLQSGIYQGGPGAVEEHPVPKKPVPIHIRFQNLSLQEALNSVVGTYGHSVWVYSETEECNGDRTFLLTFFSN